MNTRSSRPLAVAPSRFAWLRNNWLTVGGVLLCGVFITATVLMQRSEQLDLPRMGADQLATLPDAEDTDRLLLVHLTSCLYHNNGLRPWRSLKPDARHLWTTLNIEDILLRGDAVPVDEAPNGDPTLKDAAEGYAAFGQAELAKFAAEGDLKSIHRHKKRLMEAVHLARLEWVRQHAAALAEPLGH